MTVYINGARVGGPASARSSAPATPSEKPAPKPNNHVQVVDCYAIRGNVPITVGEGHYYVRMSSLLDGWKLCDIVAASVQHGRFGETRVQVYNHTAEQYMLDRPVTIDPADVDSTTSQVDYTIADKHAVVSTGDVLRIDVTKVGSKAPKGLLVQLYFQKP